MASSFRRRLLAIAGLTAVVCAAAIAALLLLARTTEAERIERARDNVSREVESLRAVVEAVPASKRTLQGRSSGSLQSGYAGSNPPTAAGANPAVADAIAQADAKQAPVLLEQVQNGAVIFVAAAPIDHDGYVFASQPVTAGRETRGLRAVVIALALLSFLLIVAALQTLAAVERGVSKLRASLAALATDLHAPVTPMPLRELDEVAAGISALAKDLERAQTERERLTKELAERERLAALGRVATGIAHEIRNPLASMKLRADLARSGGEATPAVARDLEDIASEIARLDRLVTDLLSLAGRRSGPRSTIELGDLLRRRIDLLSLWAKERGVTLECLGAAKVSADVDAVTRAIDNLLRNAIEASPPGASVTARAGEALHEGVASSFIEVTDHGAGVPADRATELFEPFFTTKADGTGLGLALARAVATAHKGTLTYVRDRDVTRFALTLGVES